MTDLPTLGIVTYGQTTVNRHRTTVARSLGRFFEDLGPHFSRIDVLAAEASPDSALYVDGEGIYDYAPALDSLRFRPLVAADGGGGILKRIVAMFRNQVRIAACLRRVDIVYVMLPSFVGLQAAAVSRFLGKPTVLYVGSDWSETGLRRLRHLGLPAVIVDWLTSLYPTVESQAVRGSHLVLVTGPRLLDRYRQWNHRTFETRPHVAFGGVDYQSVERDHSCDPKSLNLLYVGSIGPHKGLHHLLNALPELDSLGLRSVATLVGGIVPSYGAELLALARDLGVSGRFRLMGYSVDPAEIREYFAHADFLILPTLREGFPRVIYEAFSLGLPVIASELPSIREGLGGGHLAVLVAPECPAAIAEAVHGLLANPVDRQQRIRAGLDFAASRLSGSPTEQLLSLMREFGVIRPDKDPAQVIKGERAVSP